MKNIIYSSSAGVYGQPKEIPIKEDSEKKPEINNRKWPHFIDFEIKKKSKKDFELQFGRQGEFSEAFSNSFNHGGGTPYPLSRAQFEKLKDRLNLLR